MRHITQYVLAVLAALALVSCSTSKENTLSYFKNLQGDNGTLPATAGAYDIRLQPDDEISITVSSSVPEATAMFNLPMTNTATRGAITTSGQGSLETYIVDKQGYVYMPVLGAVKAEGLTTEELAARIKDQVSQTVKDPYVRVKMINCVVSVLGEVNNPHRIGVGRDRYTLLDALAAAGDLTQFGNRQNVLVIREEKNGERTYHRMNLADSNIFASPYFYLQQNDVVYVEPNAIKSDNSRYNQNNAFKLQVVGTVVSVASILASLVIALTVK